MKRLLIDILSLPCVSHVCLLLLLLLAIVVLTEAVNRTSSSLLYAIKETTKAQAMNTQRGGGPILTRAKGGRGATSIALTRTECSRIQPVNSISYRSISLDAWFSASSLRNCITSEGFCRV